MKKFKWRLQRLLDVRTKQQEALRAEVTGLTEQTAALRGRIMMEKAMLRSRLADLRQSAPDKRIAGQQAFMTCVSVVDVRIAGLQNELNTLEQKRQEKIEAMMAIRKFRKSLERLRARAQQDYAEAVSRDEQKHQDESVSIMFARKTMQAL